MTMPPAFEYAEQGSGPAVLLLPGSFGTASGWKAVQAQLGAGYRTITTSLLGYGTTPDIRPDGNDTMAQQVDVLDRILDRIDAAAHVVGHSYGGLAALAHALMGRRRPASLFLVEANPLGVLRVAGEMEHHAMFQDIQARYFSAHAAGDALAARLIIDFYGGPGTFDAMPPRVRDYIFATTAANVRDWSSGSPFEPGIDSLRSLDLPTTVVRGGLGHPAMLRIGTILHASIPGARLATIDDGAHFLPSSHPAAIAALLREHLERLAVVH
jgi:pimeloyl-ACP methyl ester carboxylesterase